MSELAATKTPISVVDLESALHAAWADKFGTPPPTNAVEVLMSQSALETGAWAKCIAFNLGNIKSPHGADGDWCFFTTHETLSTEAAQRVAAASTPSAPAHLVSPTDVVLEPRHPGCRFRAFSTLAAGARWYLDFLAAHEATAWPAVLAGDPFAFSHALKLHGYYTADEATYTAGVVRFFDAYGLPGLKDMTALMAALQSLGYSTVWSFQQDVGLVDDNTPGPLTRAKLRVMLAAQQPAPLDVA